jgi:hypothetical protein
MAVLAVSLITIAPGCRGSDRSEGIELPPVISPFRLSTLHREPVPRNLGEALDTLDRASSGTLLLKMHRGGEDVSIELHDTLGRWIRNNWQLYDRGPLYRDLAALGLKYPDDMSGLILTSWWRRIHRQPLRIEEQVAWFLEFNRRTPPPPAPRRR